MNSESDVLSLFGQYGDEFSDGVLSFGHGQTVSRHDDDVLGVDHCLDGLVAGDLHSLACTGRARSESAQDNIGQAAVHGHTHDVAKNCTRATDESTNDGHEVVVKHESFSAESPAG